jgi:hypothetical protein
MEYKTEQMGGQRQRGRLGHVKDSTTLALYWDRVEEAVTFTKEK